MVLAGGLGTRLASRLNGIPKPMADIAGRPFLEILLGRLERAGCSRVVLSVGHLHHVIRDYFGPEFRGMELVYVIEAAPMGTGGAIRMAMAEAREESLLVLNGDTYLDVDYAAMLAFHSAEAAALTIAVAEQPDISRYGEVVLDGDRITGFREKGRSGPSWINAGVYAVRRDLAWPEGLGEKFSFETDLMMPELERLRPAAFRVRGVFLDIGVPEDLDRAQEMLTKV